MDKSRMKFTVIFLIFVLLASACSLPLPSPGEETPEPQITGQPPDIVTTPEQGGGGPQVTQAGVTPAAVTPDAGATQHDVFAPSIQSGSEAGGTQTPQGGGTGPEAESTEQRVFAPSIQTGGGEGDQSGSGQFDPRVEIEVNLQTLGVGETISVTGRPVDIGAPVYALTLRDEGVQDAAPVIEVDANNQQTSGSGTSQFLEVVSVQAGPDQVVFVLRGLAPGVTTLTITASGQIQGEDGSPVEGVGTGEILLTVEP